MLYLPFINLVSGFFGIRFITLVHLQAAFHGDCSDVECSRVHGIGENELAARDVQSAGAIVSSDSKRTGFGVDLSAVDIERAESVAVIRTDRRVSVLITFGDKLAGTLCLAVDREGDVFRKHDALLADKLCAIAEDDARVSAYADAIRNGNGTRNDIPAVFQFDGVFVKELINFAGFFRTFFNIADRIVRNARAHAGFHGGFSDGYGLSFIFGFSNRFSFTVDKADACAEDKRGSVVSACACADTAAVCVAVVFL